MSTNQVVVNMEDRKAILSSLWLVVILNMIAIDVLSLFIPGTLEELAEFAGGTPITRMMLIGGILMEIPIAMVFLSRILKYGVNRWANIIAAAITILYVVGGGSAYPHYLFMGAVEVACLLAIIWVAWRWPRPQA